MANSIVKVTDIRDDGLDNVDNSLLLLVGEDGTVAPDQETVETFLKHRSGPTNIQVMKLLKTEKQGIDITVDNLTYVPDVANEEVICDESADMDEVAQNLYNFRLDHDYTPFTSPDSNSLSQEDDELAKTLSMLDGPEEVIAPPESAILSPIKGSKAPPKIKLIQSITITPPNKDKSFIGAASSLSTPAEAADEGPVSLVKEDASETGQKSDNETDIQDCTLDKIDNIPTVLTKASLPKEAGEKQLLPKSRVKFIKTAPRSKLQREKLKTKTKARVKDISYEETDELDYSDDNNLDLEFEDDENDSDFNLEEELTGKPNMKQQKTESKQSTRVFQKKNRSKEKKDNKDVSKKEGDKTENKQEVKDSYLKEEKVMEKTDEKQEKQPETPEAKQQEKKPIKKEKKPPKPIPNDFLLFSTPDIIRRVGGKEHPSTPAESVTPTKPAKIVPQRKSFEQSQSPAKTRTSVDTKTEKEKPTEDRSDTKNRRSSLGEEPKSKDRRSSTTPSNDARSKRTFDAKKTSSEETPSVEFIRSVILNEDTKTYTMETELETSQLGLDLDPTLLDNLNNDEISEDILYQVAKSLVSNPELQNAIDKGINDGVLDPTVAASLNNVVTVQSVPTESVNPAKPVIQGGTQIVRPDGRIVVIPPIERPTTRSRNKKKQEEAKTIVDKPMEEQHVAGNELTSSADEVAVEEDGEEEEEVEESEDDPNKLWCICNQPHNNRFMICCDTCEEWYHGKCVNITKSMGQQMEAEGKEWICLFCKDPLLERPQAAARRIRKASRHSRASSDSVGSNSKKSAAESAVSVPCVVCQNSSRKNSIYCSEACILAHAQGIERVIVFERSTGKMLTGNKAPSAANLDQWLKEHPGYEVVRSGGKIVTAKAGNLTQSKLKLVKNAHGGGVSLAVQKKGGVNVGVLRHATLHAAYPTPPANPKGIKKPDTKVKITAAEPLKTASDPTTPKLVQTTLVAKSTPPTAEKKKKREEPLKAKREESAGKAAKREESTAKPPENIRENVQKTVFEQLTNRLKTCPDVELTEDEVKGISTEIESQLFKCFGDTGQKYRNKYRSLIFNIKDVKNQTLWRRICEKSVNPYELVRLSPDDLASQELASWREKEAKHTLDMIKKSELELLNCNRQYVLKTHKGEQVVEDDRVDKLDNAEMIKSLTEGSALDGGEQKAETGKDKKGASKHAGHKDRKKDNERKLKRSSSKDTDRERSRKRPKSHDRKSGTGEHDRKHSNRSKERSREKQSRRSSSHKASKHKKEAISTTDKLDKKSKEILEQLVDNKIVPPLEDRLWKHVPQEDILPAIESDSDHEPSSTVTIPTPPRVPDTGDEFAGGGGGTPEIAPVVLPAESEKEVKETIMTTNTRSMSPPPKKKPPAEIWRGAVNMIDVAQISITAHEVSGDCSGLGRELSANLDIVGRISPETVWDYIGKMKCSNSKGISLIRLNATNVEEKMPYLALYSYLSSRDRLGVVKSLNKAVKDFYIYPLAPHRPIPQVLLPISGPGFEESRPALLLGIIVRDKRKRPYFAPDAPLDSVSKKSKSESPAVLKPAPSPALPKAVAAAAPVRSYTPPPVKDPRLKQPPKSEPSPIDEGDEPYSPEDSDLDAPGGPKLQSVLPVLQTAGLEAPVLPAYPIPDNCRTSSIQDTTASLPQWDTRYIMGVSSGLPSSTFEIQRQMEELNKKIEMQKSEITSMTQNIASVASTSKEIGSSTSLANIALPSNLQQILDSIKTIGDGTDQTTPPGAKQMPAAGPASDLTIPLMIPKSFSRPLNTSVPPPPLGVLVPELPEVSDTIPLNLPKGRPPPPVVEERAGVLSSLSEEQLIQKANEMLQEQEGKNKKRPHIDIQSTSMKKARNEVNLPPVPGLEDDTIL